MHFKMVRETGPKTFPRPSSHPEEGGTIPFLSTNQIAAFGTITDTYSKARCKQVRDRCMEVFEGTELKSNVYLPRNLRFQCSNNSLFTTQSTKRVFIER